MLPRPTLEKAGSSAPGEQSIEEKRESTHSAEAELEDEPDAWVEGVQMVNEPKMEGNAWERCKRAIDKHDDDLCRGWREDVDTMLVFAGLFSAAVTAFCAESFQWLSQDPAETTNALLYHISLQFSNSTSSVAEDPSILASTFVAANHDVQINTLYFLSLTLALSVSFICILCKQWLREYQRDIAISNREAIRLRQLRFEGLNAWRVPQILAALPVILQVSLLAFFAGLLDQLWHLHYQVAGVVSAVVGLTVTVVLVTTIAPAHRRLVCAKWSSYDFVPFRSPQAWLYSTLVTRIIQLFKDVPNFSWSAFDIKHLEDEYFEDQDNVTSLHRALRWAHEVLGHTGQVGITLYWCMQPDSNDPYNSWVVDTLPEYAMQEDTVGWAYYQLLFSDDALADASHFKATINLHAELLIRDVNTIFSRFLTTREMKETHWFRISGGLRWLFLSHLDAADGLNSLDNEAILVQIAMVVRELVVSVERALPPPSFSWNSFLAIVGCLSRCCSALARKIVFDIPTTLRTILYSRPALIHPLVSDMAYLLLPNETSTFPMDVKVEDTCFREEGIYVQIFDALDEVMVWASSVRPDASSLEWRELWSEARVEMARRAGFEESHFRKQRPGLLSDEPAAEPAHVEVQVSDNYQPIYISVIPLEL